MDNPPTTDSQVRTERSRCCFLFWPALSSPLATGETPKSLLGSSVTLLLSPVLATTAVRLNRKRCERRTLLASPVCPAIPKPSHLPATTAECCRGVCGLLSKHTT